MNEEVLITFNPDILGGKATVAGTRMSVESVLDLLASGMEISEIVKEYPFLTKKQILACIDYASQIIGKTKTYVFDKDVKPVQTTPHEISRRR